MNSETVQLPEVVEPGWREEQWEDLLAYVEERRVVPIIGADLVAVEVDGQQVPLYRWLATRLGEKLGLPAAMPGDGSLNDVTCRFLSARGRREDVYPRLRSVMREAAFAPPRALCQLAAITDFNLFVTTTFDPLLEQALNATRFNGEARTEVLAYAPSKVVDLPCEKERLTRPVVYHLLGKLSASPTYAVSDEDILEYICALQSEHYCPETLFSELENNHLLILGCGFSDWLVRFFLRMAKRHRLSDPRDVVEVVADSRTASDPNLVLFLQHVSSRTRIYRGGGAAAFVEELSQRWNRRQPVASGAGPLPQPLRFAPPEREMPPNAVFISYSRGDIEAVERLKSGLDAAGVTAWFDFDRLESGDDFDHKIRRCIERCTFFIPVISATTEQRVEGYFRREWNYAADRARSMAEGALFILPVAIDDTPPTAPRVHDCFRGMHWERLPGGQVTPAFARRIREALGLPPN